MISRKVGYPIRSPRLFHESNPSFFPTLLPSRYPHSTQDQTHVKGHHFRIAPAGDVLYGTGHDLLRMAVVKAGGKGREFRGSSLSLEAT
jgi:hypothetical protein